MTLTATTPAGTNEDDYVVDNTAPTVNSIAYETPPTSPTDADSLTWRVTFNEAVTGVDTGDFTVTATTATVTAVSEVSATTYDVTVSGGNLDGLDATIILAFHASQDITDTAGNALASTNPTGTTDDYEVDNTAPTVAITGVPDPSSAPFTATFTFSEDVTGFVLGDIGLGNATASGFTMTNARVYTALITPATDGEVTVDVAVGRGGGCRGQRQHRGETRPVPPTPRPSPTSPPRP